MHNSFRRKCQNIVYVVFVRLNYGFTFSHIESKKIVTLNTRSYRLSMQLCFGFFRVSWKQRFVILYDFKFVSVSKGNGKAKADIVQI